MAKPELEFFPTDNIPWVAVEGAPPGHYQKILTEDPEKMFVTRMLKVDPGGASTETFVHDFWEEVYILEGSQWDGDQFFKKGMYACRPPRHETRSISDRGGSGNIRSPIRALRHQPVL